MVYVFFFFQAEDGIRDLVRSRGLGDVYKRQEHYHFKKAVAVKSAALGDDMINLILINTISPLLFLYGQKTGELQYITRAIDLLEHLEPEHNNIIHKWESLGIKPAHAAESQALLELKKNYCDYKRCLECAIGHKILKSEKN